MARKKKIIQEKRVPESQAAGSVAPDRAGPYEALIFITGAVTLSLEVLASRIMTPYFGVSLYIWASILSITLIFLALGYQVGGQISRRREKAALQFLLLAAPVAGALAIALATAVYPMVFPLLATINLILASFLAGTILLALPLVVLSAMNPLLIAYARDTRASGDGGAGRIFFISTVGSVAGVLLTAFLLIPQLTNFRALLWMSLGLGLAAGALAWRTRGIPPGRKRLLIIGCLAVFLLSGGLLAGQRAYFKMLAQMSDIGGNFELLAEYSSVFGNIKVLAVHPENRDRKPATAYLQDGIVQNMVLDDGTVLDHTEFMLRLSEAYAPRAGKALVLGMAAGIIPRNLQRRGLEVTAVEINPNSLQAAQDYFDFDPRKIEVHIEDARTFVRRHKQAYDLVISDLFQGDCTPDYLLTREFFQELQACLTPTGLVIINTYFDPNNEIANETIMATVTAAFPHALELRSPSSAGLVSSACMVAANLPLDPQVAIDLADRGPMPPKDFQTLKAARVIDPSRLEQAQPVSDDHNIFSILFAASQLRYRSQFNQLPPNLLVN